MDESDLDVLVCLDLHESASLMEMVRVSKFAIVVNSVWLVG